ncbi:hypothetical protein BDZ97DRAFT_1933046 [Flammula alnicola]|nr:hypothetical protein BDZ97DRAFT_1933046 [Flammula alnicola]
MTKIIIWSHLQHSESDSETEESETSDALAFPLPPWLLEMESVAFRSTPHSYGSAKHPELARISAMLHLECVNLKYLEVTYIAPRSLGGPRAQGTSSRTLSVAPSSFLSAHPALEVLHMDVSGIHAPNASGHLYLADGALPRLREIKASEDIINAFRNALSMLVARWNPGLSMERQY